MYTASLLDANKCIELAPHWVKGYSRKGAAYTGLCNWRLAILAYEEGLKIEPENALMKEALAKIRNQLDRANAAAAAAAAHSPGMPPPGMPVVPGAQGTAALALLMLASLLIFFMPVLGTAVRTLSFRLAVGAALAGHLTSLLRSWPRTRSTLSNPAFLRSYEVQTAPLLFILMLSPPQPLALASPGTYALHRALRLLADTAVPRLPAVLRERALWLLTEEGTHTTLAFGATSDLIMAVTAPISIISHGSRGAILAIMYAQNVARNYHASWYHRTAIDTLTEKLDGLMHHRRCPAVISSLYARVQGIISGYARRYAS